MDVDELFDDSSIDLEVARAPPRPSRFQPKIKGKVKVEPSPPQSQSQSQSWAPKPTPLAEESPSQIDGIEASKDPTTPHLVVGNGAITTNPENEISSMEEDEDVIVHEFDVYINPSLDADTKLYDMQFPLRPSWRPYEIDEKCKEVWIKPKLSHFEIEFSLDVDNTENYNKEVDDGLMIATQTLSSSTSPYVNEFAVGVLRGNQFHVNPLRAVVQFRPSTSHLDGVQKVKRGDHHLESNLKTVEKPKESLMASDHKGKTAQDDANEVNDHIDIDEPWVLLEYLNAESPASCLYKEKAVAEARNQIPFTVKSSDYLYSYGMSTSSYNRKATGPSIRYFLTMPLEDRLKQWLSQGPQVNRFVALMHLAPTDSVEVVLRLLQHHAYLVQGLWVSESSLVCTGENALYRDYILLQFSKNRVLHERNLKVVKPDLRNRWLKLFSVNRRLFEDWKFKDDPDSLFIKQYPEIVKAQENAWSIREKNILGCLLTGGKSSSSNSNNSVNLGVASRATSSIEPCQNQERNGANSSVATTIPTKGLDGLAKAIMDLLHIHKVLSLNSIIQGLHEKTNAGLHEVENVASQIAMKVHELYVLKSLGKPALDQFWNVAIKYFNGKGRYAKVKKKEIKLAAQLLLKRDVSDADYSQVMNELCVSTGGSWILKSGALR
ncbi:hypothetical protein KSP40_PGU001647 [Platanthera guangdongensis]|uniref:DNA-directed RNA polymerase III subunit RPC5 n=1 Tax=Platanthera guangdongensis TaxID=2320717 RepID=A0ABR2MWN9_9ASPA